MPGLFDPLKAGSLALPNRIVMAALTRSRAGRTHVPNALMAEHYAQRASSGLVITEATMIAADGCAFVGEAGLFDDACVAGWRSVTDAVHGRGGRIMDGVKPYETPRRLESSEVPGIVALFRSAAERAVAAGFDGVQIHGAHGYLIDQFLRDGVNDMKDSNPPALVHHVATELDRRAISFLELRHADHKEPAERALAVIARQQFHGPLFVNGGFDRKSGEQAIASGAADAVVYGQAFIANPDLVARFAQDAAQNKLDPKTLYGGGAAGYTDYPALNAPTA